MKKVIALIVSVAIIFTMAIALPAFAGSYTVVDYADCESATYMCFDTFYGDGTIVKDGDAGQYLEDLTPSRTVSGYTSVIVRGWADFGSEVSTFGYVVDGAFTAVEGASVDRPDVVAAGYPTGIGYHITIPVGSIKGTHTIAGAALLTDGQTVVVLNRNTKGDAPAPKYNTTFTWVGEAADSAVKPYGEDGHGYCFDWVNADDEKIGAGGPATLEVGAVSTLEFRGWVGYNSAVVEKYGYMIDDNAPVLDVDPSDPGAAVADPANGGVNASRFAITVDVSGLEGEHSVVAVAKLANGNIYKIGSCVVKVGVESDPEPEKNIVNVFNSMTNTPDCWLGNGEGKATSKTVEFAANSPFTSVIFPIYWSGVNDKAPTVTVSIANANGDVVASAVKDIPGDNAMGGEWVLDNEVPAGQYTMTVSIANELTYFVLSQVGEAALDETYVKFDSNSFSFGLNFVSPNGNFVALSNDPVPPQTADASMVVFMVAAAAIVVTVILAKKKEF